LGVQQYLFLGTVLEISVGNTKMPYFKKMGGQIKVEHIISPFYPTMPPMDLIDTEALGHSCPICGASGR